MSKDARKLLINWMFDVYDIVKVLSFKTICISIEIVDLYLNLQMKRGKLLNEQDIYLLAITALFLASKIEEVVSISLEAVKVSLGNSEFSG